MKIRDFKKGDWIYCKSHDWKLSYVQPLVTNPIEFVKIVDDILFYKDYGHLRWGLVDLSRDDFKLFPKDEINANH